MNAPRNLVVCSDGTGQLWGGSDSNVVRLVRHCAKGPEQLVFYDPGVGTDSFFPATSWSEALSFRAKMLSGLALGTGIYENVAQCYEFLVENYRQGDKIFLFGFSRGAFTARSVSGLIRLFGIVRPDARPLLPLMLRAYFADREPPDPADKKPRDSAKKRRDDRLPQLAADIKAHFTDEVGREAKVHFIGVWDTVATVGGLVPQGISADNEVATKPYAHIRHAVSVGEYRAKFAPRLYEAKEPSLPAREPDKPLRWSDASGERSFEQRWFCGVHLDVGGGSDEGDKFELAYTPLHWLVTEAESCGLERAQDASYERPGASPKHGQSETVHDQALNVPFWALTGLRRRKPPLLAACDPSLRARLGDPRYEIGTAFRAARDWWWLLGSLGLTLVSWALTLGLTSLVKGGDAFELARVQLTAPWVSAPVRATYFVKELVYPLLADLVFIFASTTLLCVLSVHAVRSLRNFCPESERVHAWLRWAFQLPLCGVPAFDVCEDFFTAPYLWSGAWYFAYPLSLLSALKFSCWIALLSLFAFALVRRLATRAIVARGSVDPTCVSENTTT